MNGPADPGWLNFDIHGVVGLRAVPNAATATQLGTMVGSFAVDHDVAADIVVGGDLELMLDAAVLDHHVAYNDHAVHFRRHHLQVVVMESHYCLNGSGDVCSALLPLFDLVMVDEGAAMIRAACVRHPSGAIALAAAESAGTAPSVAQLCTRHDFSLVSDAFSVATTSGHLLGFAGPPRPPGPLRRFTTAVQPHQSMAGERGQSSTRAAARETSVSRDAPLVMSVFVERYEGARTRIAARDGEWMAQRMVGAFDLTIPRLSRDVLTGLAATSHLSLGRFLEDKRAVLAVALDEVPCFALQVPSVYSQSVASQEVARVVERLLEELSGDGPAPTGNSVA